MNTRAESLPLPGAAATWRDPKRYARPLVPLWILTPVASIYLAIVTDQAAWYRLTVVLTYVVFPILDLDVLIGRDTRNPPEGVVPRLEQDRYYTWLLYLTGIAAITAGRAQGLMR